MARHVHADLIHAWAEGAEIELMGNDGEWILYIDGSPSFVPEYEYRIKPKEPEWWENIPEHGVLCWWNGMIITVIRRCNRYLRQGTNGTAVWIDGEVTPLTNEELERFKR